MAGNIFCLIMTLLLNKKAGAGIEGEGGKKTIESFYGQGVVKCTDWDDNQFYWLHTIETRSR